MIKKLAGLFLLSFGLILSVSFAAEETTAPPAPEEALCHFSDNNETLKDPILTTLIINTDEWKNFQIKASGIWVEYNTKIHDKTGLFRWEKIDGDFSTTLTSANSTKFLCPSPPASPYSSEKNSYAFGNETYNKNQCRLQLGKVMQRCQAEKNAVLLRKNQLKTTWETETKTKDIDKAYEALATELKEISEKFSTPQTFVPTKTTFDPDKAAEQRKELATNFEILKNQQAEDKPNLEIIQATLDIIFTQFSTHFSYLEGHTTISEYNITITQRDDIKTAQDSVVTAQGATFDKVTESTIATARKVYNQHLPQINAKIHFLENRISTLTQSLFVSGSSQFEVSKLLNTTSNEGLVSNEGNLRIIKSYDEEIFCAEIKNRDNEATKKQWREICNNNLFDKLIRLVSQIIGTVGVILIIVAVIMLMTANGEESQLDKGKKLILYTLAGLLVFFMSFIIVQFIIDLLVW